MWRNRSPFRQPFPETADAVFATGDVPPALLVFVDAWTAYGGSQFVDSPGTGRYHSYLCEEVVPFVDARYRTLPDRAHRAISGKSSGGFGAMITPMLRPDLFGALASHAGDSLYELCYLAEFGKSVRHLRDYDGDIAAWWVDFQSRIPFTKPADKDLLMTLGISACFSAREDGTPELPFDPRTGVLRPETWQRWLDWDPVRMAPRYADALRSLRAVWLDAGTRDEWYLDHGHHLRDHHRTHHRRARPPGGAGQTGHPDLADDHHRHHRRVHRRRYRGRDRIRQRERRHTLD